MPDQGSNERLYQLPDPVRGDLLPDIISNHSLDYPALGCRYLLFNFHKDGIHQNSLFRQALTILYNPVSLINELGGNRITPASSFLPWNSSEKEWIETPITHARELLLASGYMGEVIIIATKNKKEEREEAEWLQSRGASVGLQIKLHLLNEFDSTEIKNNADVLLAEEVLEDDWQWGMINYFNNKSNYLFNLLKGEQLAQLEHVLKDFSQLPKSGRVVLLDRAEGILREDNWIIYGCHINKRAQLNQSLFGLHTGSFGFLDISKLWIKEGTLHK